MAGCSNCGDNTSFPAEDGRKKLKVCRRCYGAYEFYGRMMPPEFFETHRTMGSWERRGDDYTSGPWQDIAVRRMEEK